MKIPKSQSTMASSNDIEKNMSNQVIPPLSAPPYALSCEDVAAETGANTVDGLTAVEARSRLTSHGRNELEGGPGVQPLKILVRQVANAMMLVS